MTYTTLKQDTLTTLENDLTVLFDTVALPDVLDRACRYAMGVGGKRVRPLLVSGAFCDVGGGDTAMMRRACLAVELLHGYSLVHDDLPCMDDDDLRRGKPTCHKVFGENVALLVGDVLQSLAFESLTLPMPSLMCDKAVAVELLAVFAPRARRMVAGQMLDVLGENQSLTQDELEAIHTDKTGALIEASVLMGAVAGGANERTRSHLFNFAKHLGLAFQVQDDVLDVTSDTATLGKQVGSDDKLNKSTYVKLLGVDTAKAYANTLFDQACDELVQINKPDGVLMAILGELRQRNK